MAVWTEVILEDVRVRYTKRQNFKRVLRKVLRRTPPFMFDMPWLQFVNIEDSSKRTPLISMQEQWDFGFYPGGRPNRRNYGLRTLELPRPINSEEWTPLAVNPNPYTVKLTLTFVSDDRSTRVHVVVMTVEPHK